MKLERLTERIWVYPFEEERDRPNLSYIRGDRWSVTHWHWDHTFAMHAVHGLTLANERTNRYLADFRAKLEKEGTGFFLDMDETIRREYGDGRPVIVTTSDLEFRGEMTLDPGGSPVRIFQAEAPHTDDSTLVWVPGEKALILGDCSGGVFPTWEMDQALADRLAETIRETGPEICLPGHWTALDPEVIIRDLLEGEG